MPKDAVNFELWGYPVGQDDLDSPLRMREVSVGADAALLRRLAEFFAYAAEQLEVHGSAFGHEHFCDFARVPRAKQRLADIIIVAGRGMTHEAPDGDGA